MNEEELVASVSASSCVNREAVAAMTITRQMQYESKAFFWNGSRKGEAEEGAYERRNDFLYQHLLMLLKEKEVTKQRQEMPKEQTIE